MRTSTTETQKDAIPKRDGCMYALIITLAGSGINEESGTNGNARFIIKNNYYKAEQL